IKVAYGERAGTLTGGEVGWIAEAACSVAQEDRHITRTLIGNGQVLASIAIKIAYNHGMGICAGGEVCRSHEIKRIAGGGRRYPKCEHRGRGRVAIVKTRNRHKVNSRWMRVRHPHESIRGTRFQPALEVSRS